MKHRVILQAYHFIHSNHVHTSTSMLQSAGLKPVVDAA